MRKLLLLSSIGVAIALAASACGDDTGSGGGAPAGNCFDYASFSGDSPAVTFSGDVLPIFQRSCGVSGSSCHGSEAGTSDRPFLGPPMTATTTPAQIAAIRVQNVGVPSTKEPGMSRIAAGDAANSFLMHKMDATFECEDLTCASDKSCGAVMPLGQALAQGERDIVRRWILQGALDN